MGKGKPGLKKTIVKGFKVQFMPIRVDVDNNLLQIENDVYSLSEAKDYLLKNCEELTNKYRLRVLWDSKGRARVLYVWDNIIAEAVEKGMLPCDPTSQEQVASSRNVHFILTDGRS